MKTSTGEQDFKLVLQVTISSLISKSRLVLVGLSELNFYEKQMTRGDNLLQPLRGKTSTTYTLNLDILPKPATTKALGIQVTGMFKQCEDCALGKAKQCAISKKAPSKIWANDYSLT